MHYRNTEMKIDQLVNYLNEEKLNLSPAFQRGQVWTPKIRRRLIENIVQGRPIPAIFLYKEATGTRYSYNILDGKQRLESLILFIACERPDDLAITTWSKYLFASKMRKQVGFRINLPDGKKRFRDLGEQVVRDLREYSIPTIEISLTDDSHLDEIISFSSTSTNKASRLAALTLPRRWAARIRCYVQCLASSHWNKRGRKIFITSERTTTSRAFLGT